MEENDLSRRHEIIVVGGSAGSIEVLIDILQNLHLAKFPVIVVVHRKNSAESSLAQLLASRSVLPVREAEEKELIRPGVVYLAPPDYHLLIEKDHSFSLDASEKVNFSRPSIDVTFQCAVEIYGQGVIGIILSGGNTDGVEGLKSIKDAGGICIVQQPLSAGVQYMPSQAISNIDVELILDPINIAVFLNSL